MRKSPEELALQDVRIIVVTDGERILGLGPGSGRHGDPCGEAHALYRVCRNPPEILSSVTLDVGTNNEAL